jgi:hypothetical protein
MGQFYHRQHLMHAFLYKVLAPKITKLCFVFDIFLRRNISKKNRAQNVDEINGSFQQRPQGWVYVQPFLK